MKYTFNKDAIEIVCICGREMNTAKANLGKNANCKCGRKFQIGDYSQCDNLEARDQLNELHLWYQRNETFESYWLIVYRSGKNTKIEIVTNLELPDITGASKQFISVEMAFPKITRPRDDFPDIEWETHKPIRTDKLVSIRELPHKEIDLETYERLIAANMPQES